MTGGLFSGTAEVRWVPLGGATNRFRVADADADAEWKVDGRRHGIPQQSQLEVDVDYQVRTRMRMREASRSPRAC